MNRRSWQQAASWYDNCVREEGHYYHRTLILPNLLKILGKKPTGSLLDLGCGQGVLERAIPSSLEYVGVDSASDLLDEAKKRAHSQTSLFLKQDLCEEFSLDQSFNWACFLLSLQNIENPKIAIANAAKHLKKKGKLVLVLNHPCFRIPRQSSWGVDETSKSQYRKISRYMSFMEVPIQTNPGKKQNSNVTYSYHFPLSDLFSWLAKEHLVVLTLNEWCSNKVSQGAKARMEMRAKKEFPLFLTLIAEKL